MQCEGIRTMNDTDVARKKKFGWMRAKFFHNAKLFFAAHNVSHAPAASQIALNSGSHFNVIRLVCHNRGKTFVAGSVASLISAPSHLCAHLVDHRRCQPTPHAIDMAGVLAIAEANATVHMQQERQTER